MSKQPLIKQDGVILEALSNAMFRVKLENGHEILATIADCKIVRRKGKLYIINKKNPRYKQRQG